MLKPSDEQLFIIKNLETNDLVISACAGSGKTTTFLFLIKHFIEQVDIEFKILLISYNTVLKAENQEKVNRLGLTSVVQVHTIHSLASQLYGKTINDTLGFNDAIHNDEIVNDNRFSLVLIDESQDVDEDQINLFQKLNFQRLVIVGDERQELYQFRGTSCQLLKSPETYFPKCQFKRCHLTKSFRLTPLMTNFINGIDPRFYMEGVNPNYTNKLPPTLYIGDIKHDLIVVVKQTCERFGPENVLILAPSLKNWVCKYLAKAIFPKYKLYTTHRQRKLVNNTMFNDKLLISTYHQAKGMERKCVIVIGADFHYYERNLENTNPLHVALTRSSDTLIIFHDYNHFLHPWFINTQHLLNVYNKYKIPLPKSYEDEDVVEKPTTREPLKEIKDVQLINFVEFSLLYKLNDIKKTKIKEFESKEEDVKHQMINDRFEDVSDIFDTAILSACEKFMIKSRPTFIERNLITEFKKDHDIILNQFENNDEFEKFITNLKYKPDFSSTFDVKEWLILSALYKTFFIHDYPHELNQIHDFNWIDKDSDVAYFTKSVNFILDAINSQPCSPNSKVWFSKKKRKCNKTLIASTIPFIFHDTQKYIPWCFSFSKTLTEESLLKSIMYMYVTYVTECFVVCVESNLLYKLKVDKCWLEQYVNHLLESKT